MEEHPQTDMNRKHGNKQTTFEAWSVSVEKETEERALQI